MNSSGVLSLGRKEIVTANNQNFTFPGSPWQWVVWWTGLASVTNISWKGKIENYLPRGAHLRVWGIVLDNVLKVSGLKRPERLLATPAGFQVSWGTSGDCLSDSRFPWWSIKTSTSGFPLDHLKKPNEISVVPWILQIFYLFFESLFGEGRRELRGGEDPGEEI